ncbi:MAG: peptidoglycan hydrolase [Idiomarina sp.]|uniref:glucosaminidase domain-containing protein n=1 Tax=Idiomarina sp. TaxID=1874361 RepID=UPI000C0F1378|nr:glucosaminidase domain-containing protein [Idiomarina sp.]MBL4742422.1 glucosaminidase domain-containing protein [Idiomarina sp.]MBT41719.1 peptidoglycan hydrolase [Idiomarina sp.]PHQ76953.1 MAG: peptidoglycan hydrolase [Idiomarina sp.]
MRIAFIVFFIIVSLLALLLPFTTKFERPEAGQITVEGLPPVPKLGVYDELPDFSQYTDVQQKKSEFFGYLLPLIEAENLRILHMRAKLFEIEENYKANMISDADRAQLAQMVGYYEVDPSLPAEEQFALLKRRIDIVPEMMVLVQAANESAWGTSRFAQQGLNLFGQWCYREGCGIIPAQRPEDQIYEVAKFDSVNQSVRSYMRNINTHPPYADLRLLRERKRLRDQELRAIELVEGLGSYSERGDEYIEELQAMIRVNRPIVNAVKQSQEQTAN